MEISRESTAEDILSSKPCCLVLPVNIVLGRDTNSRNLPDIAVALRGQEVNLMQYHTCNTTYFHEIQYITAQVV